MNPSVKVTRLWLIMMFILGGLLLIGCRSTPPIIEGPQVVDPPPPVPPGAEVSVRIDVISERPVSYQWTTDQEGGQIIRGDTSSAAVWQAPQRPGTYNVHVGVKVDDIVIDKSVAIKVEPVSTPTPTSTTTSTPPPTDTPLPINITSSTDVDADLTVYDDFNSPVYEGSLNRSEWTSWGPAPSQITQKDGILMVDLPEKPEEKAGSGENAGLIARKYNTVTINTPTFFEAKLMLDPDKHAGNVNLHLEVDPLSPGQAWFSQCVIYGDPPDEKASIFCWDTTRPSQEGHEYLRAPVPANYGSWYKFRIEVDPATMTFTYYIDGQMIGSHIPVDAEKLKKAKFTFSIGVWRPSFEAVTGYIDDVWIGRIRQ